MYLLYSSSNGSSSCLLSSAEEIEEMLSKTGPIIPASTDRSSLKNLDTIIEEEVEESRDPISMKTAVETV
jgi:hypothetical protein